MAAEARELAERAERLGAEARERAEREARLAEREARLGAEARERELLAEIERLRGEQSPRQTEEPTN